MRSIEPAGECVPKTAPELITKRRICHQVMQDELPASTLCAPQFMGWRVRPIDKAVLAFAGCVVLLGLALAQEINSWWLLLSTFAGLNLIQAAFTGFCPAAIVFRKLGFRSGEAFR
jgi:hypothetical protein